MHRFPPVGIAARSWRLRVGAVHERSGPLSPPELFFRLGLMMLIALCFGLAAQLLVGAPE
jgi:hypothetical protein